MAANGSPWSSPRLRYALVIAAVLNTVFQGAVFLSSWGGPS
ncbi:hypothetical protein ACFC1R_26080 [Kitasatospora sp. NPDC056138]